MTLFPLPAIIFLCCLILLLIVIAIVYFTVLRKANLCACMEGSGGVEAGEPVEEEGTDAPAPTPTGVAATTSVGKKKGGGGGGGGGEKGTADTANGGRGRRPATPETNYEDIELTTEPPAPSPLPGGGGDTTPQANVDPPAEDEGEPAGEPEEPLVVAGKILLQFTYMPAANKINLTVIRVSEMPPVERGGAENIQVHLCVLPQRKQRYRTKAVPTNKGVFNETFQFIHMTIDMVENCAIRLRVYGAQRFSKRIIGECKVPLCKVDLTSPLSDEQIWKNLSPKGFVDEDEVEISKKPLTAAGDSEGASSTETLLEEDQPKPELLLNFHFVDLTGRLSVEVIKGTNFKLPHMVIDPTSFVKIKVISGKGKKIGKSKTLFRFLSSNPEFNETFVYPMSPVDLKTATMMVTVYAIGKRKGQRNIIGWFALGQNTSGPQQTQHWKTMVDNPNTDISQWHELQVAG